VERYGAPSEQEVVAVTNTVLPTQVWFNKARGSKPQNFRGAGSEPVDPTAGKGCDFCHWRELTAEDTFGRIEAPGAVSASNLFKYNANHGVILLKEHDPLGFDAPAIADLLDVSRRWLLRAGEADPAAAHPLLLWNCLHRSGASQYHGHAQTLLSRVPLPAELQLDAASAAYRAAHGAEFLWDLVRAHRAVGLAREVAVPGGGRAWLLVSVCPYKDMEVSVVGSRLSDPTVAALTFTALRGLVDRMGMRTFNLAALNLGKGEALGDWEGPGGSGGGMAGEDPVWVRVCSRGKLSVAASDFGGLEVFGGASIGHADPVTGAAARDGQAAEMGLEWGAPGGDAQEAPSG